MNAVSPIEDREEIPMDLCKWSKSNADYGRRLFNSGVEGARSGREEFLDGESLTPFFSESVRSALVPAAFGACIGVLGSYPGYRQKSIARALAFGLLGGAIGLGAGLAWESRRLTASVAGSALKNIGRVRDERWLTKHPIDYA
jgi:hypothetical protein